MISICYYYYNIIKLSNHIINNEKEEIKLWCRIGWHRRIFPILYKLGPCSYMLLKILDPILTLSFVLLLPFIYVIYFYPLHFIIYFNLFLYDNQFSFNIKLELNRKNSQYQNKIITRIIIIKINKKRV